MLPNSRSDSEDWHNSFRCYISFLTLVAYVSRKYHSSLQNPFTNRYPTLTATPTSTTSTVNSESTSQKQILLRRQLLTHWSMCSVRNQEVAAAATVAINNHHHDHDLSDLFDVVITVNPSSRDRHFSGVDANQDIVYVSSKSYWPELVDSDDPWKYLSYSTGSEGLANHVVTLADYISACMTNPSAECKYFEKCSKYLVSCCWPKAYKRATHWTSYAYRYYLHRFSNEDVYRAYDIAQHNMDPPNRRDAVLATYFLKIKSNGILKSIMREHPNPTHRESNLDHLTTAFQNVLSSATAINAYNRDTCCEFQHFLVALLAAYTKSITDIYQKNRKPPKSLPVGISGFYNIAIVLWKVARSQILPIHMRTLHTTGDIVGTLLGMPNHEHRDMYLDYFNLGNRHGKTENAEAEKPKEGNSKGDNDESDSDSDNEDDDDDDDDDDTDGLNEPTGDLPVVYCGWTNLLSSYFDSLDFLTKSYIHLSGELGKTKMRVEFVAARWYPARRLKRDLSDLILEFTDTSIPPPVDTPPPVASASPSSAPPTSTSIPPPVDTPPPVASASPSSAPPTSTDPQANIDPSPTPLHPRLLTCKQAKAVIDLLKQATKNCDHSGLNSIINLFRATDGPRFTAAMHCEAILASLMKHPNLVNCDSSFRKLNTNAIGVSKLCCPACTALLSTLRGDSEDLKFRGSHHVAYPVDLPHWLPDFEVQEVVTQIKGYLYVELPKLYNQRCRGRVSQHKNDTSLQSEASYCSTQSTENQPEFDESENPSDSESES